jgi:large subunit ribosomal protein L4e
MKSKIYSSNGEHSKEIELPKCFSSLIRQDLSQKYFEAVKSIQPHSNNFKAGQFSAMGKLRRSRRLWKNSYGKGISRTPRKIMWRRGTQFYWIGAEVSNAVGGREAHPPKIPHFLTSKKINQKERSIAFSSALSSTTSAEFLKKRYTSLVDVKLHLPIIIENKSLELKSKDFFNMLDKVLGKLVLIAIPEKKVRSGKGKRRGRTYKQTAGLLLVIGKEQVSKIKSFDTKTTSDLSISDLYPLGRLVIYTEEAIKELGEKNVN